jgi:isopentenyl-diphosphate Delta-isomerase
MVTAQSQAAELLDVVDRDDRVVDIRSRGEIHRDELLHRSVHLLVFNRAGELFLQKRSMIKDNNPGLWDFSVSGHVDSAEAYDSCVVREAREEIGLHLDTVPVRWFKVGACRQTGFEFSWIYHCRAEGPFDLDPGEIERGAWVSPRTLDRWLIDSGHELADTVHLIWPVSRRLGAPARGR